MAKHSTHQRALAEKLTGVARSLRQTGKKTVEASASIADVLKAVADVTEALGSGLGGDDAGDREPGPSPVDVQRATKVSAEVERALAKHGWPGAGAGK